MQTKSNPLATPRKNPRLASDTTKIEPPTFHILTQIPPKKNSSEKRNEKSGINITIRDREGKQKAVTPKKKQGKPMPAKQRPKKGKAKMTSSSDGPYKAHEGSNSDFDFVEQPPSKKLRSTSKGESSKPKKTKLVAKLVSTTSQQDPNSK